MSLQREKEIERGWETERKREGEEKMNQPSHVNLAREYIPKSYENMCSSQCGEKPLTQKHGLLPAFISPAPTQSSTDTHSILKK